MDTFIISDTLNLSVYEIKKEIPFIIERRSEMEGYDPNKVKWRITSTYCLGETTQYYVLVEDK